jgi:hypothetical protein
MSKQQIDQSIPVLTEVIAKDELAPVIVPQLDEEAHEEDLDIIRQQAWERLELTIRENVLKQVLNRVDFVLEHRVRDSLADAMQIAVDKLAEDIRSGLQNSIKEVVTRAVTQEINKVKNTKVS